MANYLETVENYPVRSQVQPGEIFKRIPDEAPELNESFEKIFADFKSIILPGITHWQHPSFFAYFPANSSKASILAEMLTATVAPICFSWETSPAATELEEKVLQWLGKMIGLPAGFSGVIQDTASTATLVSLLTAREKYSDYQINNRGFKEEFTLYCSSEAHSSVERAVKIAGFGKNSLRKIPVDQQFAMIPAALEEAIEKDISAGKKPLCVIATLGTTGSTAIDPLEAIGLICQHWGLWLHVDAALAGTALILPEMRWIAKGIDRVDSFVFNPHKWMFTNFDCSAYFVKDSGALIRTFEILPEYLKTNQGSQVKNYRDWGIQLGRRFRALKLWFVIRSFGVEGIRKKVRTHISMAERLAKRIQANEDFEVLAPVPLNCVCFRYHPRGLDDQELLNSLNEKLLKNLNASGKAYFTQTKLAGKFVIRIVIGQTEVEQRHVDAAWSLIQGSARIIRPEKSQN